MLFQFIVGSQLPQDTSSVGSVNGFNEALVMVIFVAIVIAIVAMRLLIRSLRRPDLHGLTREKILETWADIEKSTDHGVMGAKVAIMEADKLLDGVLKGLYLPGETMAERLKSAQYKYPDITKVWNAHRLRNQLVHDATFEITVRQAKGALNEYKAALKTLNVM